MCAPSRAAGPTSDAGKSDLGYTPLLQGWIKARFAVVRTDHEGLGTPGVHPYMIGRSEWPGCTLGGFVGSQVHPELHLLGTVAFAPQSHTATETSFLKTVAHAWI